jgi:hypothetical protein|tara:strand:+ start:114 stop:518 length:405 start_codon:yes stop_codon:yes gene_type:complete
MASITVIRTRLAANLGTISGLRTSAEMPDNPTPPIGIINLDSVDYDGAMQGGLTTYSFVVTVVVGRAAEREMQRKLDAYCDPTGSQSVKLAIESDKTLSGEVYDLRVERSSGMGSIIINDQNYLAAEFTVTVLG